MRIETVEDALGFLKAAGRAENCPLNLYLAALAFSKLFHPGRDVAAALSHMEDMARKLRGLFDESIARGGEDSLELRRHCLIQVLHRDFLYEGEEGGHADSPDVPDADLFAVIETRRGISAALGIFYMHLAREMEWQMEGLNFPGHFLVRLVMGGESLILDPAGAGRAVNAADMRVLLKRFMGPEAELSHSYSEAIEDHDILLRLQNNVKKILIDRARYQDAITLVEALRLFAPEEYRLFFDGAVLKAKTGQVQAARLDAVLYIEHARSPKERNDGERLLYEIERSLN